MAKTKKLPANYFKFVNPLIMSVIAVGMYLLLMAWLDPKNISTTYFGRVAEYVTWLGTENNRLMKQIFLIASAVHLCEAMVAVYMCHKKGIGNWAMTAWALQTTLFGIFSLRYLIWPVLETQQPQKKEKETKSTKKGKKPQVNAKQPDKQPKGQKQENKKKAKAKKEK
ncbi:hypothetical protein SK128_016096 [Halocaridina rubra]|uniref:Transmembrane protein 254 n=1 Tax=Halocaridina rubra TaxID=373956 RepID=A0AAN8XL79_HALRR